MLSSRTKSVHQNSHWDAETRSQRKRCTKAESSSNRSRGNQDQFEGLQTLPCCEMILPVNKRAIYLLRSMNNARIINSVVHIHEIIQLGKDFQHPVSVNSCLRCRFYSRVQDSAGFGLETVHAALSNLSGRVANGRPAQTSKEFTGKMARASRTTDGRVFLSQLHSKVVVGSDSPGPARYTPLRAFESEVVSKLRSHRGYSFGKALRQDQAKIAF